jgi:hypothetical protein
MKSGISLALAVFAVVALSAATALAGSASTTVDITSGAGTHFEGTVTSSSPKCVKNREVSLVYDTAGQTVGTTKTNADGNWELDGSFTAGMYHAEVAARKLGHHKGKIKKCKGGKSISRQF